MSIVKISIKSLTLPKDKNLVSVDYQISNNGRFEDEDIIINIEKDDVNLTGREFDLDFNNNDIYYGRVKLNFNSSGDDYYLSKPIVLTKNGDGFSHNNSIIVTPKIEITGDVKNAPLGGFTIKGSEFILFSGVGEHKYTDWVIKDSDGNVRWSRKGDKHNLTSIRVPNDILKLNRHYIIEVVYVSSGNERSNKGKLIIKTSGESDYSEIIGFNSDVLNSAKYDELEATYLDLLEYIVNRLALGECR